MMKTALSVLCLITVYTTTAYAQTFFSARAGINYAAVHTYLREFALGSYLDLGQSRPTLTVSALIERQLSTAFSLKSGLEYAHVHASVGEFKRRIISLYVLELPVFVQWNATIGTPSLQGFISFGPKVRYNLALTYTDEAPPSIYPSLIITARDIMNQIRPFDMLLELGGGIGYSIDSHIQLYLDGRTIIGPFDIRYVRSSTPLHVWDFRAGLGVRWRVGD
jgi:hypothetical protein